MNRVAALLVVFIPITAIGQAPKPEQFALRGWSIATEGAGIPRGQNGSEYAAEVDRKVTHGGQGAMSLRSIVARPAGFRAVTQIVKADAFRGKRLRLTGYLKTRDVAEFSGLWLRVDGPNGMLGFDNMERRPVKGTTDWTRHEVVLDVPEPAVRLAFGSLLRGVGQVWLDDLTLDVVDPQAIQSTTSYLYDPNPAEHTSNLDFEAPATDATNPVPGWKFGGYPAGSPSHAVVEKKAHGGRSFLELKATQQGVPTTSVATQDIATAPYKGKRVRFRAYLKTEDVVPRKLTCRSHLGRNTPGFKRPPRAAGGKAGPTGNPKTSWSTCLTTQSS